MSFNDLGLGEVFGEYLAIDRGPRSASVEGAVHLSHCVLAGAEHAIRDRAGVEEASNWPEIQNTISCSSQSRSAQRPCETDSGSQLTAPAMGRSGREHRPISVA